MESKTEEFEQTEYEKERGMVSRKDLRKNVLPMLDDLPDDEFHSIYNIIWSLHAGDTLYSISKNSEKRLEDELIRIKKELARMRGV